MRWGITMLTRMRTKTGAGMTLIEMLIVIGLCCVLAALLLPMGSKARQDARAMVCADNLKGLGQALALSTAQSNGYLPDVFYTFDGSGGAYDVALQTGEGEWAQDAFFQNETREIFTCPADNRRVRVLIGTPGNGAIGTPVSYAYNVSLPLMMRNSSRVPDPLNTVTFYDGDPAAVAGEWRHEIGWAEGTVRNRHAHGANYLFLDGHVESIPSFPDLAFEGGSAWVASARDTRRRTAPEPIPGGELPEPPFDPPVEPPAGPPVDVMNEDGALVPGEDVRMTITCIGADFEASGSGPRIPVTAYYALDGGSRMKIANDVFGGESVSLVVPAGTEIAIAEGTTEHIITNYSSDDGSGHTWILRDGDTVASVVGYSGLRNVKVFLEAYINASGEVTIGRNERLFLFELSDQTDYHRFSWADFQDLAVLIGFERNTRSIGGRININPSNGNNYEFRMVLPDGTTVTRDDLHADRTRSGQAGFNPDYLEYTGPATLVYVKPKGNGNQNGLIVDGNPYPLENKNRYTITSDEMNVHLYNSKRNKHGKAMGKWWIEIVAAEARIECAK